jgi:CshA-type fibril repeat protein/VCBS repeat-containing protein
VSSVTVPAHGTAAVAADGTIAYTPAANYNGADSFTYTIGDGNGGAATATVTVMVTGTNDGPVALDDVATTAEDTAVSVAVLTNDRDLDGDSLTVSAVTAPAHGTAAVNADGTIAYEPAANYTGADSFTYTVCDSNGGSATATVTVMVTGTNDGPVPVDDAATTEEDTAVLIPVLTNDRDVDGAAVTSVSAPEHGAAEVNPDGTIAYTPEADYSGEDSFSYTVDDGNGGSATATVTVTVTSVNDAPAATHDWVTTPEDAVIIIDVLWNDTDVDGDSVSVTAVSTPAHGTAEVNPDGTISYTPHADYHGADSFTYTVSDEDGASVTATVTLTVTGVNEGRGRRPRDGD